MLSNYLKTAVRSLLRHRFFSLINMFGLAIAMSICMMLIMLVADQLSYDRYNAKAERIYRIWTLDVDSQGNIMKGNMLNSASCLPLGPELMANYAGVESTVRFRRGFGNGWLAIEGQDVNIPLTGFFADANALDFFQYELAHGDPATALRDPFSVVLTRKAADKLFKDENPIGQTLAVGDQGLYTVTGILKETDNKSHIVFEGLASMSTTLALEESGKLVKLSDRWTDYWQSWTYVLMEEGKTATDLQNHLDHIYKKHIGSITNPGLYKMVFGSQPLLSITPGDMMNNSIGPQLPWEIVYFLGGLALVILLTSCFNFTNLSIARSLTRAREIGVRKVVGAARWQIFNQFIAESIVLAFSALLVSMILIAFFKPAILELNFAQMFHWDLRGGVFVYASFIVFTIVVGTLAGLFPAVVLSGFKPIAVLKNLSNVKLFSRMGMRKALLVSQFALSLFFIVTVIVLYKQLEFFTHQGHGFNMNNNFVVRLNNTPAEKLKTELQKYSNITAVSAVSHVPAAGTSHGCGIKLKMEDPAHVDAGYFLVDADYAKNMGLKLLAGEFFKENIGESNRNFVVINEAALFKLGFANPHEAIGESVIYLNDSSTKAITAVVADYNHRDLTREISPMVLMYQPEDFSVIQVAYAGSPEAASAAIQKAWAAVNPGLKIDFKEVASEINQFYDLFFGDLISVIGVVSFLAIFISCLGLLGMATYATETRIKEISIRKILGSTGLQLIILLSRSFITILAIAICIGAPLAWFVNTYWLEELAYHTTVGFGTLAISVIVLLFFAVVTVASQTIRATVVKPVDNLKNE